MKKWMAAVAVAMGCMVSAQAVDLRYINGAALSELSLAHDRVIAGTWTRGSYDPSESDEFIGYVIGATDAMLKEGVLCNAAGVSTMQLFAMVSKYLKDHPEQWTWDGASIIFLALAPVLACKK